VHLEVLDWGGSGPPILLLPGLGNTAHVFDHFAHPTAGYDLSTRARDLAGVVDHFKFDRVILMGHSIAGDELTKFAAMFPARTGALVYLDAAYDRTRVMQLPQPMYPIPPTDAHRRRRNTPPIWRCVELARSRGGAIQHAIRST
jgi:pimeloyl-ACP methyl ester carboxylesterase